jgi:hypothetical protein
MRLELTLTNSLRRTKLRGMRRFVGRVCKSGHGGAVPLRGLLFVGCILVASATRAQAPASVPVTEISPTEGVSRQNAVSAYNVNGRVFVDGVKYTTLNAALADPSCSNGCTIDMSGDLSPGALGLGSVDWGSRPITLLLGPHTYTTSHIVLHTDSHIIGVGMGFSSSSSFPATVIQCTSKTEDCITITQTDQPVQHVLLEGFRLYAPKANASKGFYASAQPAMGLWYSTFRNICVGACGPELEGFHGGNFVFEALNKANLGVNQFLDFYNVQAFRSSAAGHDLDLRGNNAQFLFNQCEFDGAAGFGDRKKSALHDDGGVNIWIGDFVRGLSLMPNTIKFVLLTCQLSDTCVSLNGSWDIDFDLVHMETSNIGFEWNQGATNGNVNTTIEKSYIATSGNNNGYGAILANKTGSGNYSITLLANYIESTPDTLFTGDKNNLNGIFNYGLGGNVDTNIASLNRIASSLQVSNVQSDIGAPLTSRGIELSSSPSWGSGASVSNVTATSTGQTAEWTINVGGGTPEANPSVTVTFPVGYNAIPNCHLSQVGGSQSLLLWDQSKALVTSSTFTLNGTPKVSATIRVYMQCGP